MIRKIIFWSHLVAAVTAGIVILIMSATGVLLTYEFQMNESASMKILSSESTEGERIPLEQVLAIADEHSGQESAAGVAVRNDPAAPYEAVIGRRGRVFVDAYSGEYLGAAPASSVGQFMGAMSSWHRWLSMDGESRALGRGITGVSNLIFLFILFSGIYLWLPKIWNRASIVMRLWFKKNPANSKARDYNWHHVIGIWSVIPLIAIVATAVAFSYPEVRQTTLRIFDGAQRGGAPAPVIGAEIEVPAGAEPMNLDTLFEITQKQAEGWHKITVIPARNSTSPVEMQIAFTNGHQPIKESTWHLNPYTGETVDKLGWQHKSRAAKISLIIRRLHTGEFFGIAGQTIAGLVSLFACVMVWTGWALAWRRLVSPILAKRGLASKVPTS